MRQWVAMYVIFPLIFGGYIYTNTTYRWAAADVAQGKVEIREQLKEVKEDLKERIDRLDQRTQATLLEIKDLLRPLPRSLPNPEAYE